MTSQGGGPGQAPTGGRHPVADGRSTAWLLLPAVTATVLLLPYAGQLGLGRWQADEYHNFVDQRVLGWHALLARLYVSPRPVSELLIYGYGAAVLAAGRPLVVEALAVLWAGSVAGMVLAARAALPEQAHRWAAAGGLAVAQLVFVLETNPATEVFYWPVAAAAYLPMATGAVSLLFLLRADMTASRRAWCCGTLLLAACSHEIGAALALGFAMAAAGWGLLAGRVAAGSLHPAGAAVRRWWWLAPGLAGAGVILSLLLFRSGFSDLGADEFGAAAKTYAGHLIPSTLSSLRQLATDAAGLGYPGGTVGGAFAVKALFCAGFALTWLRAAGRGPCAWHGALAAALVFAAFFSLAAAYYHYGDLCCERQATTRHWLLDLALALCAAAALGRVHARVPAWLGPVLLTLSLCPIVLRADGLRADYGALGFAASARARTWESGRKAGTDAMEFYLPPADDDMLIRGTSAAVGTYRMDDHPPVIVGDVGRFFGKTVVHVCQPWQLPQSWLVDGRFVPACPPHDGPPDRVHVSR